MQARSTMLNDERCATQLDPACAARARIPMRQARRSRRGAARATRASPR